MNDRKKIVIELSDRDLETLLMFLHNQQSIALREAKDSNGLLSFNRHRILESVTEQLVQSQLGDLYDQIKSER
jgi:hypothetical protein